IGFWNTRPRYFARRCSGIRDTSAPSILIEPESMGSRPEIVLSRVDLPAPLDPMTVTKSDSASSSDRSCRGLRSLTVPGKNVLVLSSLLGLVLTLPSRPLHRPRRRPPPCPSCPSSPAAPPRRREFRVRAARGSV